MKQTKQVRAVVIDDHGEQHEIVTGYTEDCNPFAVVEQAAKEQGLHYADIIEVQFPLGRW